jgi:hypothetical protein
MKSSGGAGVASVSLRFAGGGPGEAGELARGERAMGSRAYA